MQQSQSRFYASMAIVAMLVVLAGFGPGLVDPSMRRAPLTIAVGAHGAIFAAWLVLYLTQALLVGQGRIDLHRLASCVATARGLRRKRCKTLRYRASLARAIKKISQNHANLCKTLHGPPAALGTRRRTEISENVSPRSESFHRASGRARRGAARSRMGRGRK
jgi:hypothetical protein